MKKDKLVKLIKTSGKIVVVFSLFLFELLLTCIRFLFANAETTDQNQKLNNAAIGGEWNARTEEFDDGTDPAGWYEKR
jgi:hypothetical protein